jgi:hypothetical protein
MQVNLHFLLLGSLASCGYSIGAGRAPGGLTSLAVETKDQEALDVDAAALVSRAVRRAIARGPSTQLAEEGAEGTLRVRLIEARADLAPLADPRLRAAQYRAEIRLVATLVRTDGKLLWTSSLIVGEAPYLSTPGALERLDGARRRALERAAEDAADRLVAAMLR